MVADKELDGEEVKVLMVDEVVADVAPKVVEWIETISLDVDDTACTKVVVEVEVNSDVEIDAIEQLAQLNTIVCAPWP